MLNVKLLVHDVTSRLVKDVYNIWNKHKTLQFISDIPIVNDKIKSNLDAARCQT